MKRYFALGYVLGLLVAASVLLSLPARVQATTVPVTLSWINNCDEECTFNLYRGSYGKPGCTGVAKPVPLVTGLTETSYTDTTAVLGQGPFSYNVASVSGGKVSACATEVQCTLKSKVCVIK